MPIKRRIMIKLNIKTDTMIQILGGASLVGIILGSILFVGYQIGKEQTVIMAGTNQGIQIQQNSGNHELQRNLEKTLPLSRDHQLDMPVPKKRDWPKALTKKEITPSSKQDRLKQDRQPELKHGKPYQDRPGKQR